MRISTIFSRAAVCTAVMSALSGVAFAEEAKKSDTMEHLTIFGAKNPVNDVPGSAHMLNEEALEKFDFTDIMRTLTSVPGVYVLEEDGYGLRPNIGMRGTGQNRSERVTILEDNVLAAPAAYAAPSAYYFPTAGRMQQIEVLKGTSSAMYGPRTTGGVINMLSRQIPTEPLAGQLNLQAGGDGYGKLHAFVGGAGENVSSLVEVFRYEADGFKDINHSDAETGFVKNDILAKTRIDFGANQQQSLEFKIKYSDESSDETYMGLTDADFAANPYIRYSASQLDNMSTTHKQVQINHEIQLTERFTLGTTAYYNDFGRNWYKVNKIAGKSLGSGGIEAASAFDKDANGGTLAVDIKANNRNYLSKGVQSTLMADLDDHQVKVGVRLHEDEMDRFQWVDKYEMDAGYDFSLTSAGVPGSDSNRIDSAEAFAFFIHDEYTLGDFSINAGLRYEDITVERHDWGKSDATRTTTAKHKKNDVDVWLPSVALTYRMNEELVLLAGVQKGFAPPAPGNESAEAEESINYELGFRFTQAALSAEAIFFYSDYDNLHGNCTASQGCDEDKIGNQYNAGEFKTSGLEVMAGYEFAVGAFAVPVNLTYTYTDTEFQNSFESALETWLEVEAGDALPYVPENQLQLSVGLTADNWGSDLLVRYMGEMRTVAGTGSIIADELIDSRTVVDFVAHYNMSANQEITLMVDNLLDEEYATTRTHGSLMVGKPRTFTLGYKYNF